MVATSYVWDIENDTHLIELDDSAAATVYTSPPARFGEVISQRSSGQTSYYHFDAHESSRHLTDSTENALNHYVYSAFGEKVNVNDLETQQNAFEYKGGLGYITIEVLSVFYVRRRHYNPTTGRWLTVDPAGVVDASHLYTYASNNPTNMADPSGLYPCCCCCAEGLSAKWERRLEYILPGNPLDPTPIGLMWGHTFEVYAHLSFQWSSLESGAFPCDVEWWECATLGGSLGQKPDEWFPAHKAGKIPGTFFGHYQPNFELHCDPNPPSNRQSFTLLDTPQVDFPTSRNAKFAITLRSSPGCGCGSITKYYTQRLLSDDKNFVFDPFKRYPRDLKYQKWEITPGVSDDEEPKGCTLAKLHALMQDP